MSPAAVLAALAVELRSPSPPIVKTCNNHLPCPTIHYDPVVLTARMGSSNGARPVATTTDPRHMNTTMRSSKEEIASAAVELIDMQSDELQQLQQRQRVLWALVALLSAALLVRG